MLHRSSKLKTSVRFVFIAIGLLLIAMIPGNHVDGWQENTRAILVINAAAPGMPINKDILGTNLPAWINPWRFADPELHELTKSAGLTLIRMPGGSWANGYNWLSCEVDYADICSWASRPTDFIKFVQAVGTDGMYTVNQNGTSKEAAALVAFFNGSLTDDREIGIDVRGTDWKRVSDWAKLRAEGGVPEPIYVKYWEIGNETYGGTENSGKDCTEWGWEEVWTCDGTEYVNGIGSGANRKEGFLEFRDAMLKIDPTILVGAVGIPLQEEWSNWGNEVIAAAGDEMDFYVIHEYGYLYSPETFKEVLEEPHITWPLIMDNVRESFDRHANGRQVPIAVTEFNMFAVQEFDSEQLMTRVLNAIYLADTLGQMIVNGVGIATQWNLLNGKAITGTDYGLIDADTFVRSTQYYVYPIWAKFGSEMLPVSNSLSPSSELAVYAGRTKGEMLSIVAINKTGRSIDSSIMFENVSGFASGKVDVVEADSLDAQTITFNEQDDPAVDFSDAPSIPLSDLSNPIQYSFTPYSITLLRLEIEPDAIVVMPTAGTTKITESAEDQAIVTDSDIAASPNPAETSVETQPLSDQIFENDQLVNQVNSTYLIGGVVVMMLLFGAAGVYWYRRKLP